MKVVPAAGRVTSTCLWPIYTRSVALYSMILFIDMNNSIHSEEKNNQNGYLCIPVLTILLFDL